MEAGASVVLVKKKITTYNDRRDWCPYKNEERQEEVDEYVLHPELLHAVLDEG